MPKRKPEKAAQPVYNLIYSRPHRITGEVHVNRDMDQLSPQYESSGERTCLLLLSCCHDVTQIASQPFREAYIDHRQKQRTHVPDFRVQVTEKPVIIEYKPLPVIVREDVMEKFIALGRHYSSSGQRFSILTSDQIDIQPRKKNAAILRRFRFSPISGQSKSRLLELVKDGPKAICNLALDNSVPETFREVCVLIAHGFLSFDWAQLLTYSAHVSLPDQPYRRLCYADLEHSGRFTALLQELVVGRRPSDTGLLAAARARDWSVPDPSPFGFIGELPERAFTGRFRTPGCLIGKAGYSSDRDDSVDSIQENASTTRSPGGR